MKNSKWLSGMLALALVFSIALAGCATLTWNSPVTESGSASALQTAVDDAGGKEIASYTVILNAFVLGRSTYDGLVATAARSGKTVDVLTKNYLVYTKVTAYTR